MKPEKPYAQLLDFFHGFVILINSSRFYAEHAKQLAEMLQKQDIADDILENPLVELKSAWDGYHHDATPKNSLVMFVDLGFRKLAAHMRDPQVRKLVMALIRFVDQDTGTELFARAANIRLFDPSDEDGPAVVTLVVHSNLGFKQWFMDPDRTPIKGIHGSFAIESEE